MITVACVIWGDKFEDRYVTNLQNMVNRNTTREYQFVCLSDRSIPGVETRKLIPGYSGWWNKLQLFHAGMNLGDRVVYFDLDTIIVNNIDWLLDYDGVFMGIEDLGSVNSHQPHLKNVLQTGVMSFNTSMHYKVWDAFSKNPNASKKFRGDGEFLNWLVPPYGRSLLQHEFPGKLKSYKYQVYDEGVTDDLSIVCFHGRPSIIQAMTETVQTPRATYKPQSWIKNYWK